MKTKAILIYLILFGLAATCSAATITVHADGSGDYPTIQAAIDAAIEGDTIEVWPGTYTGDGNRDIDPNGKNLTICSTDPNDPNIVATTIIDCNGTEAEPHRGFYFHTGEDENSVVAGFTIKNGYANRGGAIYSHSCSPQIIDCDIVNNSADNYGGAVYIYSGSPNISKCTITGNTAKRGGGIYFDASSSKLINCTFKNNLAKQFGGGIFFNRSNPKLTNCTISNNKALSYSGGGICLFESDPIISNCTISENVIRREGGGICLWWSNPILVNCIITGNTAYDSYGHGGGISCWSSNPTIVSCTIVSNWAGDGGGGISCGYHSSPTIAQCTIANNFADTYGGGIYSSASYPYILGSIVYGNQASAGNELYLTDWNGTIWPSYCAISYSDINRDQYDIYVNHSTINWEEGNIDADPCFVNPGYWSDPCNTPSEPNDDLWNDGDYHLLADSPCINAGDPNYIAEPNEATDLDGQPRIFLGRVDIGAYEFVPSLEVPMHFTPRTLNPKSKGKWVKAHLVLPEGFSVEDVNTNSPARIIEPFTADSNYMDVFLNEDGLVKIMAAFDRADFCSNGSAQGNVVVIGRLTNGQYFYGTDTIRIKTNNLEYLAVLTSSWLAAGCGAPDWCAGADLNRDSVVDFIDFAFFDGCCLEFIKN